MSFAGCGGGEGSDKAGTEVPDPAASLPTATLSASPSSIAVGDTSKLVWSSTNADKCSSMQFETGDAPTGELNVQPQTTTEYTLECSGSSGTVSVNTTITVSITSNDTTFYVANAPLGDNQNSGSADSPWKDIQFGIDQLSPGDTLIVNSGTYSETLLLQSAINSGTANEPISLIAEDSVIIDGSNLTPTNRQGLITIRDGSFITVQNFELANFRTTTGVEINDTPVGILVEGASHDVTLKNNRIHHIENLSSCDQNSGCGPGANGIAVYGNTQTPITNLVLDGNEVHHCILSSSEALTLNGNVDGFKILNNYVHDNNNIGIDFIGYETDVCSSCSESQNRARNGTVSGNRSINNSTKLALANFSNNPWYGNDDGSAGGFYVDGGRNILFERNISSQNDLGFEFASEHSNKASEDILMINNFIYLNREVGLTLGGYAQSTSDEGGGNANNIYIYNNSFYRNRGWGTEVSFAFRVKNTSIANNIFYGTSNVSDNFSEETNSQKENVSWTNNIWWAADNSDTSGIQGDFILADPNFVNPDIGELAISSGSPAIDAGIIQPDLQTWLDSFWLIKYPNGIISSHGELDINGDPRLMGSLDIGADEF